MRVAIVCFNYGISVGSLTSSLPGMLAEAGHLVDIYADQRSVDYCVGSFDHAGVTLRIIKESGIIASLSHVLTRLLKARGDRFTQYFPKIFRFYVACPTTAPLIANLKKNMEENPPDIIIAYDIWSLTALYWTRKPVIYLNLELQSWDTENWSFPHKYLLKTLERDILSNVPQVYITSPLRGVIFARENQYPEEKVRCLPVVPRGREQAQSNQFFRNKFGLCPETRIVLHAGHITTWACLHEVIPTVAQWPEKTALIIHTWDRKIVDPAYLEQLMTLAKGLPVFFSFESIAKDETCSAWASADIGLAFYEAIDDNFTEILFSSNKFGEYLKAGLPVVCSDHDSLKKFVEEHGIGKAVSPQDCAEAITTICENYDSYAAAVKQCHQQYFILEPYVDALLDDMATLSVHGAA